MSLFRTLAMNPSVEKITKPAKTLVPQLISEIIMASLKRKRKAIFQTKAIKMIITQANVSKIRPPG